MILTTKNLEILNFQNSMKSSMPSKIDPSALSYMKSNMDLDINKEDLFRQSLRPRPFTAQNLTKPKRNLGQTLLE
jgi:hypothetical protein